MLRLCFQQFLLLLSLLVLVICDDPYYVIIPQLGNDVPTNDGINTDINKRVGDATKVFRSWSTNSEIGTLYWWAPLNGDNKAYFAGEKNILIVEDIGILPQSTDSRAVRQDSQSLHHLAKRAITSQAPAPDHLKMICQKPGQSLKDLDGYYYDDTAGSGIQVYIIDSGLRSSHQDFAGYNINWMFTGPFPSKDKTDSDSSNGHGTSMASAALGIKDGSAKRAGLTVVRADRHSDGQSKLAPLTWLDAIKQVYDDIKANHQGKAVVSMSWGFDDANDQSPQNVKALVSALKGQYTKLLKPLIDTLDAPALVAAGNNAFPPPKPVDTIPAVLAGDTVPDLIVVGGVGEDGAAVDYYQTAPFVKINAPADQVQTAYFTGDGDYELIDGTSAATAMTAGVVAYLMGLGSSGSDARSTLYSKAYPRVKNGPPVLWNTADSSKVAPPSCAFASDPDGARGLCPNLAEGGWCDCGTAGDYAVMPAPTICAYSSLPSSATVALSSTSCVAPVTEIKTLTIVPVPTP